jgi:hypothetical protein
MNNRKIEQKLAEQTDMLKELKKSLDAITEAMKPARGTVKAPRTRKPTEQGSNIAKALQSITKEQD